MSVLSWVTQCSGGLAWVALLGLSVFVLIREANASDRGYESHGIVSVNTLTGAGIWTIIFAYYCLVIHVNIVCFATRSCYGMWDMIVHLRDAEKSRLVRGLRSPLRRPGSAASVSSDETLAASPSCSASSSDAGDLDIEKYADDPTSAAAAADRVIHAIVIPNYKEEVDTLAETLDVLASHPQARECYDVRFLMFPFSFHSSFPSHHHIPTPFAELSTDPRLRTPDLPRHGAT